MECKYNQDEFCTNDQCPMCAGYCPVPDIEGVCKYEERIDVYYKMSPKGCLLAALLNAEVEPLDNYTVDKIWNDFAEMMAKCGYLREES